MLDSPESEGYAFTTAPGSDESAPFITEGCKADEPGGFNKPRHSRRSIFRKVCAVLDRKAYGYFILAQVAVLSAYVAVVCLRTPASMSSARPSPAGLVYSPAQGYVRYRKQRFDADLVIESEYIGDPSPEVDLAWTKLLQNMNIAVSPEDLQRIGAESIPAPGQPRKFVAGLSVFHELHCLKRLRQHTWPDYYFPNQTVDDARINRLHTDHCIDVLRQAILCHADSALFTLQWPQDSTIPRADFSHEHQCVDWEALNAWAGERAIPDEQMGRLKRPVNGDASPKG